ncbi:MAG: Unknown protein, partial [uncultured Aureispira sp.]
SWTLKNSAGQTVESGSGYADGDASITETFCLADGCYDFTINDSYGDGICCSYGNGSYSLVDASGTSLISGAAFTSTETQQACLGSTGGGGGGGTTPSTTQIYGDYFESGFGNWNDGGGDCARYNGSRSSEGSYSIRLRDNSSTASSMTSDAFDATSYDQITVDFTFYAYSMETGEDFFVKIYNGSSWSTVEAYVSGTDFSNNQFYTASVTLDKANYNFTSSAQLRFQCDASANADQVYIDEVVVTGIVGNARTMGNSIAELNTPSNNANTLPSLDEVALEMNLYPNPATSVLNIDILNTEATFVGRIMDATGKTLWTGDIEAGNNQINLNQLVTGIYYFTAVKQDGTVITKKFVKKN